MSRKSRNRKGEVKKFVHNLIVIYFQKRKRRTVEMTWGETATRKFNYMKNVDNKVAVSPSRPLICSTAREDDAERELPDLNLYSPKCQRWGGECLRNLEIIKSSVGFVISAYQIAAERLR